MQKTEIANERSAGVVIEYILETFHAPLPEDLEQISALMHNVVRDYGDTHSEVVQLEAIWNDLRAELEMHLQKEERILFPMIQQLEAAEQAGDSMPTLHCGSINHPIGQMEFEHDHASEALVHIRRLSNDFQTPEQVDSNWHALLNRLMRFEEDLHRHIQIENTVLHPLACALEAKLQRV